MSRNLNPALPDRRLILCSVAAVFTFLAGAGGAAAATFVVNRSDDIVPRGTGATCLVAASTDCTLREAVIKANGSPGSVINFAAAMNGVPITLTLTNPGGNASFPPIVNDENAAATGDLDVTESVSILGNGELNTIIRAGTTTANGIDKVFGLNPNCDHAVNVVIDGVTVRYGRNNQATTDPLFGFTGGGIDFCGFGGGSLTLSNSTISDNTNVNAYGGGLNFDTVGASTGTITVTNVKFLRNRTLSTTFIGTGGGLNVFGEGYALTMTGSTFDANSTVGMEGGGMFLRPTRNMTIAIHGTTFSNNSAGSRGGGLSFLSGADGSNPTQSLTIDQGSSFTGNTSGTLAGQAAEGGGLYATLGNANSSFTLSKATVTGNSLGASADKRGGGGIAVGGNSGTLTIAFSRIVGNSIGAPVSGANQGTGLHKDNNNGSVTATNNWWGCSTGPSAAPCDTAIVSGAGSGGPGAITATPWLRDSLTASPATIVTNQSTALTASVNTNSSGGGVAGNVDRLLGLPIAFSGVGGAISAAQATVQAGGTATATYTAAAAGVGNLAAAVIDADGTTPPASNVLSITASQAGTATSITGTAPSPSVTGQAVAVSFVVAGAFGNLPTAPGGTVTVTDGVVSCTAAVAAGSCALSPTTAGTKNLTATYTGDANFLLSTSAPFPHVVNKANTTTTVVSSLPEPSVPGQLVTVSASVAATAPGAGSPSGTISVTDGVDSCLITLPAAGCTVTPATIGTRSFVGTYSGDASFNGSASAGLAHTVNKASTTTALSAALPDPSVVGQGVTATFAVTVNPPSSGTPTGTVSVSDGVDSCIATLPGTSCVVALSTPGARTLTATYVGDVNFNGSASAGLAHTVNPAATTTAITNAAPLGATPSVRGEAVTVAFSVAVVPPGVGTPAGSVTVSDGVDSCTGTVAAGSCALAITTVGARTLTATFAGSASFAASTSAGAPHTVNQAGTTTTITADTPDPSTTGQSVAVTFTVSVTAPGAGTPTGNVTVTDGVASCAGTVAAGTCSLALSTVGARTLTATYAGDAGFTGSASGGAPHTVVAAATTTTITNGAGLSTTPSVVGQPVSVTFSVVPNPPGAGTPTGNVTASDGVSSCTGTVAAGSCSVTFVTPGVRTLTATYAGDTSFNGSVSAGVSHTVNKGATTTAITTALPDPTVVGQPVIVSFAVTVTPPSAGTPTGTVTVSDGVDSCLAALPATSCAVALTTPGARTLTATYAGDTTFDGSASTGHSHTVNAAATTTAITNAAALAAIPTVRGQAVAVTFTVAAVAPGAGVPAGNVTVSDGVDSCTGTVSAGSCALGLTTVGARSLTATYAGNASFVSSASSGAPHTVNQAATTTALLTDTPDPSSAGQSVAVTFTVSVTAPGAGTPTGNVTVTDGADSCTGTVAAGACSLALSTVGARTLTATYAGDAGFTGSSSGGAPHSVVAAATTTTITNAAGLSSTPSVVGQAVTVVFSVAPNPPAGGTPTGSVTVSDGVSSCTATVVAGSCSVTLVTTGARTLTATYAGDSTFGGSSSVGTAHTVNMAATTMAIVSALPDPSAAGQPVTVTFTVTVNAPGSGTPTGSVAVSDGVDSCTASVAAGSCTLTPGSAGPRTLTATYAGDARFAGATSTGFLHTVNAAVTALAVNPNPASGTIGTLLRASAVLSGGASPTGSILFELFSPAVPPGSGSPVFTETVGVTSGNGAYATAGGFAANQLGTWQWRATYGGDVNNSGQVSALAAVSVQAATSEIPMDPAGLALLALALAAAGAVLARRSA